MRAVIGIDAAPIKLFLQELEVIVFWSGDPSAVKPRVRVTEIANTDDGGSTFADRVCFVVHACITLQSKGDVLYRDIIRIDPRAFNQDILQPDGSQSPERILDCAEQVIPNRVQTRLPGVPWKESL